jgi:hypothetical protein
MWNMSLGDGGSFAIAMATNPVPDWLQIAEAVGQAVGTLAVLVALATLWWQFRKDRGDRDARDAQVIAEGQRHDAQIAALRQAEDDRLAAQARSIVPGIYRGSAFNDRIWNLRIDNWSTGPISNLDVAILIEDANGNAVADGYRLANRESIGQAMADLFLPEFTQALDQMRTHFDAFVEHMRTNAASLAENPEQMAAVTEQFNANAPELELSPEMAASLRAQVNQAIHLQFSDEFENILYANRFTAMAIETVRSDYIPHLRIRYQDNAGYTWERTDTAGPKRVSATETQNANNS